MPLGAFKAALMGTAGVSAGADVVLLSTTTASNASAVSITSGIDSTYGVPQCTRIRLLMVGVGKSKRRPY